MGGYDNRTSREFTNNRQKAGKMNAIKSGKLYERYVSDEKAQYIMTFSEYKKKHRLYDKYMANDSLKNTLSFFEYEKLHQKQP